MDISGESLLGQEDFGNFCGWICSSDEGVKECMKDILWGILLESRPIEEG
jgi:hypothetical protein